MDMGDLTAHNFLSYIQMFEFLISFGQILCGQTHGVANRLCQEVTYATQGRTQLLLRRPELAAKERVSSCPLFVSFPVQFRDRVYGTIDVTSAPSSGPVTSTGPALPLPVARLLAQICGWLLYMFELTAFLQGQSQQPDLEAYKSLTKRERDVLALICRGCDQEAIAEALTITPQTSKNHHQQLYRRLGVHDEQALLLVAYQVGFFSPLEELL